MSDISILTDHISQFRFTAFPSNSLLYGGRVTPTVTPLWHLKIKISSTWQNGAPPRWRHCNVWKQKLFYGPRWPWWWSDRFQL